MTEQGYNASIVRDLAIHMPLLRNGALRRLAHQEDPLARTGTPGSNRVPPGMMHCSTNFNCEKTETDQHIIRHPQVRTHTPKQTHTRTSTHKHTPTHTHTNTRTHPHAHTHTHTHTHTHEYRAGHQIANVRRTCKQLRAQSQLELSESKLPVTKILECIGAEHNQETA